MSLGDSMVDHLATPDIELDAESLFGVSVQWKLPAFSVRNPYVPILDSAYKFSEDVTKAVLLGFAHNRRVYIHGPHGAGKTSHIEQVAARLNWSCIRINLDGHVTRSDLIGRDMVVLRGEKQVTEFVPGLLVTALQHPIALIFDEYDAARPDVLFVLQRLLEADGSLTLLDENRVIQPHPGFRLFATANTAGQGDSTGLYAGTNYVNQAQMDRWHVISRVDFLEADAELAVLLAKVPLLERNVGHAMVVFAGLCRQAFSNGDVLSLFSMRTLISWAENQVLLGDSELALRLAFLNRCEAEEACLLLEIFQRCFGSEIS